MTPDEVTFRQLLDPMSVDEFFKSYSDKRHVHLKGAVPDVQKLFSWDGFSALLNTTSVWNAHTMKMAKDGENIEPNQFCRSGFTREGTGTLEPDWQKVGRLMRQGATVVLDLVEKLDPGIASVASALQSAMGARVTCNAYCSWSQTQAFRSHFDTMEVFALHIEGKKTWRLYDGRFEHPMEAPGFNFASFPTSEHEARKGQVIDEIDMQPGDLLYIPKGQYHDALASSEACLHLSYGTARPNGIDLLRQTLSGLRDDPLFRKDVPGLDQDDARRAHVQALATRLSEILTSGETDAAVQTEMMRQVTADLPGFALPTPEAQHGYRVKPFGAELKRRGSSWAISHGGEKVELEGDAAEIAKWILDRDRFTMRDLESAFPETPDGLVRDTVATLRRLALTRAA